LRRDLLQCINIVSPSFDIDRSALTCFLLFTLHSLTREKMMIPWTHGKFLSITVCALQHWKSNNNASASIAFSTSSTPAAHPERCSLQVRWKKGQLVLKKFVQGSRAPKPWSIWTEHWAGAFSAGEKMPVGTHCCSGYQSYLFNKIVESGLMVPKAGAIVCTSSVPCISCCSTHGGPCFRLLWNTARKKRKAIDSFVLL
jgi:hypothetical protein